MLNVKELICISSDCATDRGGAEIIPGEKYYVHYTTWHTNSETILYAIYKDSVIVGFFDAVAMQAHFRPVDEFRNDKIDQILL